MSSKGLHPAFGSRFMPRALDDIAATDPERVYALIPQSENLSDVFKVVTFADVSRATNALAQWLKETIGCSDAFETLAYMGISDLRYAIVFLAAVKCGYKLLLTSVRNSAWMNASLLQQTNCSKYLYSAEVRPNIAKIQEHCTSLKTVEVMPFSQIIGAAEPTYVPFNKEWEESKRDPILVLHSSGSTGPPKPIVMNHETFAVADRDRFLSSPAGRKNQNWSLFNFSGGGLFYSPFPAFHLAGFSSLLPLPIYSTSATVVLSSPTTPPSGHLIAEIMQQISLRAMFCPPIIAEQLLKEPEGISLAGRLDFILYAGGPLSQSTGNALSAVTDLCQFYGQTETGPIQALVPRREDWAYLEWHPSQNHTMQPSVDGSFEMTLQPKLATMCSLAYNFPEEDIWHTRDLFKPHPSKQNLWTFYGRSDDIIVLLNGEKFNPATMETAIQSHPAVSAALIVGQGRAQAALLVESKGGLESFGPQDILEQIWPTVEGANSKAPGHAQIVRSKILICMAETQFEKAAKGTVIRRSTENSLAKEIDQLYSEESAKEESIPELPKAEGKSAVENYVQAIVLSCFNPHGDIALEDNLFELGMDSLQVSELCAKLKASLRQAGQDLIAGWVSVKLVYTYPSINSLAQAIHESLVTGKPNHESVPREMETLVERWTQGLPDKNASAPVVSSVSCVVLVGSTGSLGSHILERLVQDDRIESVICLDRSPNARQRYEQSMDMYERPPEFSDSKVDFWLCDYSAKYENFGLDGDQLQILQSKADTFIFNAWKVDFNHPLVSFDQVHIRAVRQLINIAHSCYRKAGIMFISSISAVGRWEHVTGERTAAETIAPTCEVAEAMGYAESKQVAEQILAIASDRCQLPVSILRVGQIAGPLRRGQWNPREWFPILVKTSKSLNMVPQDLPDVDWIPVDCLAAIVDDLLHFAPNSPLKVFNLTNPALVPWSSLVARIITTAKGDIQRVPLTTWIETLASQPTNETNLRDLPALKILEFFESLSLKHNTLQYKHEEALKASPNFRELEPIQPAMMEHWVGEMDRQYIAALSGR